jgi:large subunit ribosomal protein L24
MALRIKKGDHVKVIAGAHKGKIGTVLSTNAINHTVTVEKIGLIKRHIKPSQINPRGGTKEIHKPLPLSNVAVIVDSAKGTTSRVSFASSKDGTKVRMAKRTKKEIK